MQDNIDPAEWMKLTKAAQLLDVHIYTVQRWIRQRRIDGCKCGGRWYVKRAEIQALFKRPNLNPPPKMAVRMPQTSEWARRILVKARIHGEPPTPPQAG